MSHFKLRTESLIDQQEPSITVFLENISQIEGFVKISLSLDTKLIIGCRIGENVTVENPWMLVDKQILRQDLRMQKADSEFVKHRREIISYPDSELLLVCMNFNPNERADFYLCLDVDVKHTFLAIQKAEQNRMRAHVLSCLSRVAKPWISLGSEREISGNMNFISRSMFIVELQSQFPFFDKRAHFEMLETTDRKNGYMELLPARFVPKFVLKKRVDRSTQSVAGKKTVLLQTNMTGHRDKPTQYSFEYPKPKPFAGAELLTFLQGVYDDISSELRGHLEICHFVNDYQRLVKTPSRTTMQHPKVEASFQDIMSCKDRKISAITLNPLVSGIIAAAYVYQPDFDMVTKDLTLGPRISADDSEQHLVLVWSSKEAIRPVLYLHAIREVTALSFCPYNENILVGGCSGGQIVVWDITDKLGKPQWPTRCSEVAYEYHVLIERLTSWMKKAPGPNHLFPVIISSFDTGHLTAVSSIVWVPPTHYISRYGCYEASAEARPHMQILTASLDAARLLVYDLAPGNEPPPRRRAKASRLSKLPAGLRAPSRTVAEMRYNFHPNYEMRLADAGFQSVMSILCRNDRYAYACKNPETLEALEQTSYFRQLGLLRPFDATPQLMCTTGRGTLLTASWDGHTYDQGLRVNSEKCRVAVFKVVHDGPVLVCEANPFLPDVLLTIGGSVVAVWNPAKSQRPLLWRKSRRRYCSAIWSFVHPLSFVTVRTDGFYEYWHLSIFSQQPVLCSKTKGSKILQLHSDARKLHVRKKSFISTDTVGAFKILTLSSPSSRIEDRDIDEAAEFFEQSLRVQDFLHGLRTRCLQKAAKERKPTAVEAVSDFHLPPTLSEPAGKASPKGRAEHFMVKRVRRYEQKRMQHMQTELLARKRVHFEDVEQYILVQATGKHLHAKKFSSAVALAEEPIARIMRSLSAVELKAQASRKMKRRRNRRSQMQKIREDYRQMEQLVILQIAQQPFSLEFDWSTYVHSRQAVPRRRFLRCSRFPTVLLIDQEGGSI